jgi:hypothetical protein
LPGPRQEVGTRDIQYKPEGAHARLRFNDNRAGI